MVKSSKELEYEEGNKVRKKDTLELIKKKEETQFHKRRLMNVADSYQDFARMLQFLPSEGEDCKETDRQAYLHNCRMQENRKALSGQLKSFAETCIRVAEEPLEIKSLSEKAFKNAMTVLKEYKVSLKLGYCFRLTRSETLYFELKPLRFCKTTLEEVAGILSVAFGKNMVCISHDDFDTDGEYHTYEFEEEPKYQIMTGIARVIKEGKTISGDNYSILEGRDHRIVMMLSDGVGSGKCAGQSSDVVMELMEALLQSGEGMENATLFLNSTFSTIVSEGNMPTLDLCEIDLNDGSCEFVKAGAVASFIKSGRVVEQVNGGGTPLGFFPKEEMPVVRRHLGRDYYVIMMTDGVLENLNGEDTEAVFSEYISQLEYKNPKEMANKILQFAILRGGGEVRDDMTVFVAGIFDESML